MATGRILLLSVLTMSLTPKLFYAQSCEGLQDKGSSTVSITSAKVIPANTFKKTGGAENLGDLPAFCRVIAKLKPTSDSDIGIEVWLPVSGWNGKFLAVGSGGWGGSIAYGAMADALRRGYATSATDDGHTGSSASFIMGHPQEFIDFAYRAEHEMTVEAKSLIKIFYGRDPRYSYWDGCSGGGREGLLQAARYPDEFDGIIAGDPANVRRNAWALWLANQTFRNAADYIPSNKYSMIHQAVLDACDANDGLKDGLIENPESCQVDFKRLECKGDDRADCLTPRQVKTAETMISPATDAGGKVFFPRLEPGTELRWARLAGGPVPADLFLDQFRYVVYQNPDWDWRAFDLDRDAEKANAVDNGVDELDPDLTAFANHNGKLLLYHGWADQQVAPGSTVQFYQSVLDATKDHARSSEWIRLFMVPGMGHCSGGEGPDTFDKISIIEQWVEQGKAPTEIVASHRTAGKVDRTRPLCPYPETARYRGTGSIDEAINFSCTSSR
ncbi:MAG TPA: tannase/feruloyl esterase family alpha/beta hydrolase [Terracidiphilus sp.]|nr:tannase/feruloyl esterase family alpha/beta hydrolase [Terracidiphilus sp.]